jgi:hypothetical protein
MPAHRAKIDDRVRSKLEELGVDAVRSKLVWIMNVTTLAQQDNREPLGDDVSASRREMQEWLREKAARDARWVKAGVYVAIASAFIAAVAAVFAFLGWRFPIPWGSRPSTAALTRFGGERPARTSYGRVACCNLPEGDAFDRRGAGLDL